METGRPLKTLHLFSNHKWTGPAEPAVNLALAQKEAGHTVLFACGICPDNGTSAVRDKAIARGLKPLNGLTLSKHRRRQSDAQDAERIGLVLSKEKPDIVHTHMSNDHDIALKAIALSDHTPIVIRSLYDPEPKLTRRFKGMLAKTDGLVFLSQVGYARIVLESLFAPERCIIVEGAIDTERFVPQPRSGPLQQELGIEPDDFVVGIVARVQRHRRFEVFIEAARIASQTNPHLKFMIVGRGTYLNQVAVEPVERLGLTDRFIFTGYRSDDFVDTINLFDTKVFLVPGSDGSCRAVREAMAIGKPIVAADRGMLKEIVKDNVDGFVIDDTPGNLAEAILTLANDRSRAEAMGRAAAEKAHTRFTLNDQTERVEQLYRSRVTPA